MSLLKWVMDLLCTEKERIPWAASHSGPGSYWVSTREKGQEEWSEPREVRIPGDDLYLCGTRDGRSYYKAKPRSAEESLWIDLISGPMSMRRLDEWSCGKELRWMKIQKPRKPTW